MEAYYSKFNLTHFHIEVQVNQDTLFFIDESKIRVILNNLFSNSVQLQKHEFGPKHISLTIDLVYTAAIITSEDNGVGIEKNIILKFSTCL